MENYIECNVIFLENKEGLVKTKDKIGNIFILSNEEIKENDWFVDDVNQIRQSITSDKDYWNVRKDYKKIVATTDSSLTYKKETDYRVDLCLPQPSIEFIQSFVEEYNKGNIINKVLVEIEQIYDDSNPYASMRFSAAISGDEDNYDKYKELDESSFKYQLKLQDNTIITKQVEERMYNKKEVEEILNKAIRFGIDLEAGEYNEMYKLGNPSDIWIKENLK